MRLYSDVNFFGFLHCESPSVVVQAGKDRGGSRWVCQMVHDPDELQASPSVLDLLDTLPQCFEVYFKSGLGD